MYEISRLYTKTPIVKRSNSSLRIQRKKLSQPLTTPADRILFLQRTIGNQAVQRMVRSGALQAKLRIGQPGDMYEQEADRVADAVMRMPDLGVQRLVEPEEEEEETLQTKPLANQITPLVQVQRQEEPEEDEEKELIQAKPLAEQITPLAQRQVKEEEEEELIQSKENSSGTVEVTPSIESSINSLRGGGQPLPESTRRYFGPRFSYDFSQVMIHAGSETVQMTRKLNAEAFTYGRDIYFGAGKYSPGTSSGKRLLAHELTHVVQQTGGKSIWRKKGEGEDTLPADIPEVGIKGGESKTPSDQTRLARNYNEREDGTYDTPDGRIVSFEQALAESQVINSEGIYMGVYLARYNAVKEKYGLSEEQLGLLSKKAGFLNKFKTGDIVLRLMSAEDSQNLARITDSNYSHSGIIQVKDRRVWVLDSYPTAKKTGHPGTREESTVSISFEEFFSDHHEEKIVNGLVLRIKGITSEIRNYINSLIDHYNVERTTFDYEFKVDNDQYSLYCSELVWRILSESDAPVLPPNEYEFTKTIVADLINKLETLIAIMKNQGTDTNELEKKLEKLKETLNSFESATTEELYSPGSLERTHGLEGIAGFSRKGKIEGDFELIIVKGTVPDDWWDTPDPYVEIESGFFGGTVKTSTRDDTTRPVWNESLITLDYESLRDVTLKIYDEDVLSDDHIATLNGDLRPVRPKGQIFTLGTGDVTLTVKVKGVREEGMPGAFGPQAPRSEPSP